MGVDKANMGPAKAPKRKTIAKADEKAKEILEKASETAKQHLEASVLFRRLNKMLTNQTTGCPQTTRSLMRPMNT